MDTVDISDESQRVAGEVFLGCFKELPVFFSKG